MKNIKIWAACSFLALMGLSSCDLTELNVNPNEPTSDVNFNMLNARLVSTMRGAYIIEGDNEQRYKSLQIDFYSQIMDAAGGFATRNNGTMDDWNSRVWTSRQQNLAALNVVIRDTKAESFPNTVGVARIWRVFLQSMNVDFFGPAPFPGSKDNLMETQPYKSVQDCYTEFFTELDEAVKMLDPNGAAIFVDNANEDLVYKGDVEKWARFANSLRLRLAMRLSEIAPDVCKSQAEAALAGGVMTSNADKAQLPPIGNNSWGNNYNYKMFQIDWSGPCNLTSTFYKLLVNIGGQAWPAGVVNTTPTLDKNPAIPVSANHPAVVDPRGPKMFQPALIGGDWKGLPVGLQKDNEEGFKHENYAEMGFLVKDGAVDLGHPYDVMMYEEVCFLKAEAYARNILSGNAKSEYENGVRASFEKWGVADKADAYLASKEKNEAGTSANYDDQANGGNTVLEKIITQKYIAAYPDVAFESWNDKRRLNLPRFDLLAYSLETGFATSITDPMSYIQRAKYPAIEQTTDKVEYDKGLTLLSGPDLVTTPIWWASKKSNYCTSTK